MSELEGNNSRVYLDGRFFRLGEHKFFLKGLTYGPFCPNDSGLPFASPAKTREDFHLIRQLRVNTLRLYEVPPAWFLELALEFGLKLLVDIPWNKCACFLESAHERREARSLVEQAARACGGHPAVLGFSVVNEIPTDIVRWSGAQKISDFIDELIGVVKNLHPECLCTFGNYPPTEYLRPGELDFFCFNVYLHQPKSFENYLARLQMIADAKPLVIGETGIDSLREGETRQAQMLAWQIDLAFRGGVAGLCLYSFTDEWFKDGREVLDWGFGLTTRDRSLKPAFTTVSSLYEGAPYFPLKQHPLVSVVVASFNGSRTLTTCLESLQRLNYPAYEVILVDDGSSDDTPQIIRRFPQVRYYRHQQNLGLSAARNTGILASRGEIIAFTDGDCRVDDDWLYYLVGSLLNSRFVGIGGPNLLPPEDSWIAAAVMASPGGPTQVMLTDRMAEHIPGCNMAFYKWALEAVAYFDPVFRQAGDDVDICWRLQQLGYRIGFCPAAMVWHYRRSTVPDYLKQQRGYGEAEALLVRKHPDRFSGFGGAMWNGRIYSTSRYGVVFRTPRIYHGLFGSGFFQSLYTAPPDTLTMFYTSLEYLVLIALPLCVAAINFEFLAPIALLSLLAPMGVSIAAAVQAELPRKKKRFWSRPLIALLFYLQPLVRGWARYQGRFNRQSKALSTHETLASLSLHSPGASFNEVQYWVESNLDRFAFLKFVMDRLNEEGWQSKTDSGWQNYDLEIAGSHWSRLQLLTLAEAHKGGKWLIRCRLMTFWTFTAQITFFAILGIETILIAYWGQTPWWHWLILLSLSGMIYWQHRQCKNLQRIIAAFLDDSAKKLNLTKVVLQASPSANVIPASPSIPSPSSAKPTLWARLIKKVHFYRHN